MTLLNQANIQNIVNRVEKLSDNHQGKWGILTANEMICHLSDGLRVALKDRPIEEKGGFLHHTLMKWMVLNMKNWPKNAATHEQINPKKEGTKPESFEADREKLIKLIERFVALSPDYIWPNHHLLGKFSELQWRLWAYKHLDFHLNQFGV